MGFAPEKEDMKIVIMFADGELGVWEDLNVSKYEEDEQLELKRAAEEKAKPVEIKAKLDNLANKEDGVAKEREDKKEVAGGEVEKSETIKNVEEIAKK